MFDLGSVQEAEHLWCHLDSWKHFQRLRSPRKAMRLQRSGHGRGNPTGFVEVRYSRFCVGMKARKQVFSSSSNSSISSSSHHLRQVMP